MNYYLNETLFKQSHSTFLNWSNRSYFKVTNFLWCHNTLQLKQINLINIFYDVTWKWSLDFTTI